MKARFYCLLCVVGMWSFAMTSEAFGENATAVSFRQYYLDIQLFSMIPGGGLESCREYGDGGAGVNSSVGFFANDERQFSVNVDASMREREFVATVRVKPKDSDKTTKATNRELTFSDLRSQTIEIALSDDGRVYRLHLLPRIKEFPKPRVLDTGQLQLDHWSFQNSPVILNDQDYVGRMSMSSVELASIDLPGIAKIEFSLLPFRNAKPVGSLKAGVINIVHESGISLHISDVTNGIHHEQLLGGPYQVFVRWSEPSMTATEYRKELVKTIAHVRKQIESGDLPAGKDWFKRLERSLNSDRVMMMSTGLRAIPSQDRINQK